ncbi:MAG: tetratricopeptide repeat protein [Blastocatellales bacterium]
MTFRRTAGFCLAFSILLITATAQAQNTTQPRQRSPLDVTGWGIVYDTPATKHVKVRNEVPYLGALAIDIYTPPDLKEGEKRPAVVFINAVGDSPTNKVKSWEIYKSWPRLVAAHGLVGVSMDADGERIQECLRGVFDFLTNKGAGYGIDGERLGIYAASANVSGATRYLAGEHAAKGIRAAALYYGRVPEGQLRTDLPVLFIVAESDARGTNPSLTSLWQRVIETKAPWSLLFAHNLPHAFDGASDNDSARRIIQQTLAFWKSHLEPVPAPPWQPSKAREIIAATYGRTPKRAADLLADWIRDNPSDVTAQIQYGRTLLQLRRFDEATVAYEKALALGSSDPGIYSGLGQIKYGQRRYEQAIPLLTLAIEAGMRNSLMYGQLASSQLHIGRNEEAVNTYLKAFEVGIPPGANTRGVAYFNLACGYTKLGQKDKAFEALTSAVAEGFTNRNAYETDEDLAPLRTEPRFQELLDRLPKS